MWRLRQNTALVMTNWNAKQHSYEELRALVIDELLARTCRSFDDLQEKVSQAILKRSNQWPRPPRETGIAYQGAVVYLHPDDSSTILEVFWDLFRQGVITLGMDARNPGWPWFRLSWFGENIKSQSEFRFHDTSSYIAMIKTYDPEYFARGDLVPRGSGGFVLRKITAIRVGNAGSGGGSGVSALARCGSFKRTMGSDIW